jgi:hypothetical protein
MEAMSDFDVDLVISRMVDGVATPTDWASFDAAATKDVGLWRELAHAQRVHQTLSQAVLAEIAVADRVALPSPSMLASSNAGAGAVQRTDIDGGLHRRSRLISSWGGWGVAAAVTLAFVSMRPDQTASVPVPIPGTETIRTAAEAFNLYQTLKGETKPGTLVRELPEKILLNTTPSADGKGFDITYLRQIVERTHVDTLYRESSDEGGRKVLAPLDIIPTKATDVPLSVRTPL